MHRRDLSGRQYPEGPRHSALGNFHRHAFEAHLVLCNLLSATGMVIDRAVVLTAAEQAEYTALWRTSTKQAVIALRKALDALPAEDK